jgi:ATP-dependent helicase IRC3
MLRPYQNDTLNAAKAAYLNGVYKQLVVLPTASGKTVIFSNLAKHLGISKRVLVLVNQEELADQAAEKIKKWNPEDSVSVEMAARQSNPSDRFVVASVQTLSAGNGKRLAKFDPATVGAIICDEAHLSVTNSWSTVLEHFGLLEGNPHKILLFGCTATPNRTDNVGLAAVYDEVVYTYTIKDGIKDGWLANLRGCQVKTPVSLDGVGTRSGEFIPAQLGNAINTPLRNKILVEGWKRYANGLRTLAFCVDIQHAKDVAAEFLAQGVKAEAIWGGDPERADKIQRLRTGETSLLANCQLLTTGFDCWQVECILMARPYGSQLTYTQALGRVLRIPDELGGIGLVKAKELGLPIAKSEGIVIDVFDSTSRHSLTGIASVFGLPPKMDTKGKTILEVIEQVDLASVQHPMANLMECTDLDSIQMYAAQVDLLAINYPQEVLDNTEFRWQLRHDGVYVLMLPKGKVTITPTTLDKYEVEGVVEGVSFGPSEMPTLPEAFRFADAMIRQWGRNIINLVRRNPKAKWKNDPITPAQIKSLTMILKRKNMPIPDWSKLSKVDGIALFMKVNNYFGPSKKSA